MFVFARVPLRRGQDYPSDSVAVIKRAEVFCRLILQKLILSHFDFFNTARHNKSLKYQRRLFISVDRSR